MDGLDPGLAALAFWGFVSSLIVVSSWYAARKRATRYETRRRIIESGKLISFDSEIRSFASAVVLVAMLLSPGWGQGQTRDDTNEDVLPGTTGESSLAAPADYPYYTSSPYQRDPAAAFPARPVEFLRQREEALNRRAADDCDHAVPLLAELTRDYTDDGELWAALGLCQARLGQERKAIESLQAAVELGTTQTSPSFEMLPGELMVTIASLYAAEGEEQQALHWLREALRSRYTGRPYLSERPELQALANNEDFAELFGQPPSGNWSRVERWRFDIAFLQDQVATLHYDPDHRTPAGELEDYLDALSRDVPTLNDEQIVARLTLFMGKLGAGHDLFLFDPASPGSPRSFALRPYFFGDELYVIDAADPSLMGARIVAIAGKSVQEVYRVVAASIARDNNMTPRWTAPLAMMQPVMLEALGLVEQAGEVTLTLVDRDGQIRELRPELDVPPSNSPALVPPPSVDPPIYLSRPQSGYWLQALPEANGLYVQVNGMRDYPGETFSDFTERLQREASRPEVDHLILDLRHNIGGNDYATYALVRALVYFDALPEKGRLFVLIGRNTFSAAQGFIARLEPLTEAVFVGEPTSSRPNGLGRAGQFRLPFSGHFGLLSSEYAQTSLPEDHRIWTAPDMPVGLSFEDWSAGRDPALDAILEVVGK